jgi:hypothetical protein
MPVWRQPIRRRITSKRWPVGEEVPHRPQDRKAFYGAIRSHSRLKRIHEQAQRDKDATFQERSFLHNFYNFAKEAVAGTI